MSGRQYLAQWKYTREEGEAQDLSVPVPPLVGGFLAEGLASEVSLACFSAVFAMSAACFSVRFGRSARTALPKDIDWSPVIFDFRSVKGIFRLFATWSAAMN